MPYQPPVRDYAFLLRDVLKLEQYAELPAFADASMDVVDQILEEAGRFTGEVLAPLNGVGDKVGCTWNEDHTVVTPPGFKEAYAQLVEAGWPALGSDPNYGGQGLPHVVNIAFSEMSSGANMAFSMYPGLTHGAYSAIYVGGSEEQKQLYLPKLASGQWGGTMNLTEPHCGTDLGLLRTKAVPQSDGAYKISGQKIWISGGEHDLTENIVHLVIARIEGAPAGTRGISLFIVPKFIPDADGNPGHSESPSASASGESTPSGSAAGGSAAPESAAPTSEAAPAVEAQAVTASEGEMYIELSQDSFSPGEVTIEVVNEGNATHDLVVERDGADVAASDTIGPGQSTTLTVTLEAGEYVFYCSIGNHRAMGMETTVTVAA